MAVCAVVAGASSFAAITDWLHDLDDPAWARLGFTRGVPAGTTVWRLLTRVDDTLRRPTASNYPAGNGTCAYRPTTRPC